MNYISDTNLLEDKSQIVQQIAQQNPNLKIIASSVVGVANYGLAKSEKDIKIVVLYIPNAASFMFFSSPYVVTPTFNGYTIEIKDIRKYFTTFLGKHSWLDIEFMYSPYFSCIPKYRDFFYTWREELQKMVNINMRGWMTSLYVDITSYVNQHNLVAALLYVVLAHRYLDGNNLDNLFIYDKDNYHSYGLNHLLETDDRAVKLSEITSDFAELSLLSQADADGFFRIDKRTQQLAGEFFNTYVTKNCWEKEEYILKLTEPERRAYEYILQHIQNDSVKISISKAIEESKISRPVFYNLFNKMTAQKLITLTNHGGLGTDIKFLVDVKDITV